MDNKYNELEKIGLTQEKNLQCFDGKSGSKMLSKTPSSRFFLNYLSI